MLKFLYYTLLLTISFSNISFANKNDVAIPSDHSFAGILLLPYLDSISNSLVFYLNHSQQLVAEGKFDKALMINKRIITVLNKLPQTAINKEKTALAYYNKGNCYRFTSKYSAAIDEYKKAIKIASSNNFLRHEAVTLNSLGGLYFEIGMKDKGFDLCKKALDIYERNFPEMHADICLLHTNLGSIYVTEGDYPNAYEHLNSALNLNKKINSSYYSSLIYSALGNLYFETKDYYAAREFLEKGLKISKQLNNIPLQVANLSNLGSLYQAEREYQLSINMLKEAYDLAKKSNDLYLQKEVLLVLIESYELSGNIKEAYFSQKEYQEIYQNFYTDELRLKLSLAEVDLDNIQKEKEILALNVINERQKFNIKRNKYIITFGSIIFLGLIIIIIFYTQNQNYKHHVKITSLENKLIKLQIKPHFLFNVLSSIQGYITLNRKLDAAEYLSKFARLIRNVLEQSQLEFTSVSKEIEIVSYYLELQQLRFNHSFSFNIQTNGIDAQNTLIPPLLLQPIVENAIEHGLKNINYSGVLKISFEIADNKTMLIKIHDNGCGILNTKKQSRDNGQYLIKEKQSISLKVIEEQLKIYSKKHKINYTLKVTSPSKMDNIKGSLGTLVELKLPYIVQP